jgi:uncharacterized metal-binding protein YceD (DUF177 family)
MKPQVAPWSVPVRTNELGRGLQRRLVADDAVRARVAKALDLAALNALEADVRVEPTDEGWTVSGRVHADLVQTCGITLEPLPAVIATDFSVRCVEAAEPEADEGEVEVRFEESDPPDVIENGVVDLGAYVVEHLTLAVDPFPRKAGAEFVQPEEPAEPSPFAALAALKRDKDEG